MERMVNKNFLMLSCFAAVVAGCNRNEPKSQAYAIGVSVETVASLDECVYPVQIEKVGDYLVVLDVGNKSQCLAAFSLGGELVQRFGDAGRAENEVGEVSHFSRRVTRKYRYTNPGVFFIMCLTAWKKSPANTSTSILKDYQSVLIMYTLTAAESSVCQIPTKSVSLIQATGEARLHIMFIRQHV